MKQPKNNMINKNYSPDTAHLPNKEDMKKWMEGGREKDLKIKKAQKRFLDKWNRTKNK